MFFFNGPTFELFRFGYLFSSTLPLLFLLVPIASLLSSLGHQISSLAIFKPYYLCYKTFKIRSWIDYVRIPGLKEVSKNYGCDGHFLESWISHHVGIYYLFFLHYLYPFLDSSSFPREELMLWLFTLGNIDLWVFVLSLHVSNPALTLPSLRLSGPMAYSRWPCNHFSQDEASSAEPENSLRPFLIFLLYASSPRFQLKKW